MKERTLTMWDGFNLAAGASLFVSLYWVVCILIGAEVPFLLVDLAAQVVP